LVLGGVSQRQFIKVLSYGEQRVILSVTNNPVESGNSLNHTGLLTRRGEK